MDSKKDFYIVGIGASAGGLDAIQQLFDHLPNNTGIAYVIVQHLSPDFKSLMPELLAKHTEMQIFTVEDKQELMPNCIYLNQRMKNLFVKGNRLYLLDKAPKNNLNLPIDIFFHTLGEEHKEKSIGVILSGTGSDGSRGIKTIKEAGGTVMVQDPHTAQFDGMSNTAIGNNMVDFILSPQNLAEVIAKIPEQRIDINTDDNNSQSNAVIFYKVLAEVHKISGIDFRQYKKNTIVRRLEKRMNINNIDLLNDYYVYLKSSSKEKEMLKQDFLIGVTSFFRDVEAFESLKKNVIPHLCETSSKNKTIRVWVAGCSTGEEVYSIAILIDDYIRSNKLNRDFKIFATDVDSLALNIAGQGVFHVNISSELDNYYLENYFIKTADKIEIIKRIREKIVFSNHNILKDPPFIRMDLITCRNLLIYLESKIQQKIFLNFQFSLNKFGYLFLGNSESLGDTSKFFKPVDNKWKIYQNISDTNQIPSQHNPESRISTITYKEQSQVIKSPEYRFKENPANKFHNYLSKRFSPSSIFIDKDYNILFIKGDAGKKLQHSEGMFENNLLKIVSPEIGAVIRTGIRRLEAEHNDVLIKDVVYLSEHGTHTFDLTFHKPSDLSDYGNVYLIHFGEDMILDESTSVIENIPIDEVSKQRLADVENELKFTKSELQNVVEELETSNEELQSSNEELMASNEELQSTNEELQSVNEELYTVNAELQEKNRELQVLNNDVANLLDSTDIGTLFLDLNLKIRKYTPALQRIFNLHDSDIGRPISSFASNFSDEIRGVIIKKSQDAIDQLTSIEQEVTDFEGNHSLMRIIPFVTADKRIDGVVITFTDISMVKKAEQQGVLSEQKYRNIFANMTEGFAHAKVIVDKHGKAIDWEYITVNPAFEKLTGINGDKVIGKRVTEVMPGIVDDPTDWIGLCGDTALTGAEHYIEAELMPLGANYAVHTFQPKKGEWAATFWDTSDRLKAENEVKLSELRLKEAQKLAMLGNFEHELASGKLWWSNQSYHILGFDDKKAPLLFDDFIKHLEKADAKRLTQLVKGTIDLDQEYHMTFKYEMPKTKQIKYISLSAEVRSCENKNARCFVGTVQDITKQKVAELKLSESESLFKSIFINAGIGMATVSLEGKPMSVNPELERITGYSEKELTTMSFSDFTHPDDMHTDSERYSKLVSGELQSYRLDKRYIRKDGEVVWGRLTVTAVRNAKKKVLYAVALVKDISREKEAEAKLALEKQFNERVAETSPNGVYIYDVQKGLNVFMNKRSQDVLGFKLDEMLAMSRAEFKDLFHPDDLEVMRDHIVDLARLKKPLKVEYRFKHKDGHWVWCYSIDAPFEFDQDGNMISFIGSFIDLTEKKLFEKELMDAKQAAEIANIYKNQFLANMSHEIRTPMNGVIGFADLLKDDDISPASRHRYVEVIKQGSNQLLGLINDIIDISKIEAGELQLAQKPCSLNDLLKNLESTFNEIKKDRQKEHLTIRANVPDEYKELVIETDPLRLQQVLSNLIGNALKFSEKGTIEFGYELNGELITFYVKDQGPGIPKDKVELIYNRFEQLEQDDPGTNEGTGLGLSISKGIIKLLKGNLWVDSVVGEGTCFTFEFPCILHKNLEKSLVLEKDDHLRDDKHRGVLLVAEDDPINIEYFKALFKQMPYTVYYAKNGKKAVEMYGEHPEIDVVLMDIRMPVMDGNTAAKHILEHDPDARIIAQTAHAMASDAENYLRNGFVDYISKPINKDELIRKVSELIRSNNA